MTGQAAIHVGVGGWDFDPWRTSFYPPGLPRTRQLEHAAAHLTATEVNATFYKLQKPETYARWAKMVPDEFRFAIKGSRFCTNRKALGEAAEAIGRFCGQGFTELGDKLGPINWQLAPTKRFDAEEISAFLGLLPTSRDGFGCATPSSRATRASAAASSSPWRAPPAWRSSSPTATNIRKSPIPPPASSMRASSGRGRRSRTAIPTGT